MQELIEDVVRGIGWATLRVVTFGRYSGGTGQDRLPEGAIGLAIVLAAMYVTYAMTA